MITIEKNVKMKSNIAKDIPFGDMEIGDSFQIPEDANLGFIRNRANYYSIKNPDYNFTIRKFEGGYRCWRIPTRK